MGQSVLVDCNKMISIGDCTSITYNCTLSDSNHHYTINENNVVFRKDGEIHIGTFNWIGNNSFICKGTVTSYGTLCAHGSLLNKNYTEINNRPVTLAGAPAKIVARGYKRIFDSRTEYKIDCYFSNHKEDDCIKEDPTFTDNCELKYFL